MRRRPSAKRREGELARARDGGGRAGTREELGEREKQQAVVGALGRLDEDNRIILVLRDMESLDYAAIGEILGLPAGTVRSRLHRARLAIRDLLKPVMGQVG